MASFYDASDMRLSKIFGITCSIITVVTITPLLLLIIWFEKNIAKNTTLVNHFGVVVCHCGLLIMSILVFETCLELFGPCANTLVCQLYIMMKNVAIIQFTAQFAAISVAKYKYIFVHKNPIGHHDNFWCFCFNLNIGVLNLISQLVFQMLPGRNSYLYYHCSNETPLPTDQGKINFFYQFTFTATVVIYIVVICKVKLFKQKDLVVPFTIENSNSHWLTQTLRSSFADILTLTLVLLSLAPAFALSIVLNKTDPEKLLLSPYFDLVQVHIHLVPLVCGALLTGTFYMKNVKLRQAVYREAKSLISQYVG